MKYQINLLSKRKESLLDKLIHFALTYLRYILIITQIVVISVFFYKFKIDQEIVDYQDSVDQKKEIIEISQPLFVEAKTTDFQVKEVKKILNQQGHFLKLFDYLLSVFPEKLFLTKISIKGDVVLLEGYGNDGLLIKNFYQRLTKDKKFKTVNLKSLKKTDIGLNFSIELSQFN